MNRFFQKLADEWERTLMSVVMFALLVYLSGVAYKMLTDDEEGSQNTVKPKAPHHFFDFTSTAYIEPAKLPAAINPFNFHIQVSVAPPKQEPGAKPKPEPGAKPKPEPGAKPKPEPGAKPQTGAKTPPSKETPPPKKPEKPKPSRKIAVQYRGFLKGVDSQVAFYSALDSQGKKTEAKPAKEGAKIHGILEIKSFDADSMTIIMGGKDVVVKRGKKQEFVIQ